MFWKRRLLKKNPLEHEICPDEARPVQELGYKDTIINCKLGKLVEGVQL
jgi:hypothetical protein